MIAMSRLLGMQPQVLHGIHQGAVPITACQNAIEYVCIHIGHLMHVLLECVHALCKAIGQPSQSLRRSTNGTI